MIQLLIIWTLTVSNQSLESDSVTFSSELANAIVKDLEDCDLAREQLSLHESKDSLQSLAYQTVTKENEHLKEQIDKKMKWWQQALIWFGVGYIASEAISR